LLTFHIYWDSRKIIAGLARGSTVFNRSLNIIFLILELEILETSRFLGHIVVMNKIPVLIFGFLLAHLSFAADDETCALMAGDEIDEEEFSEILGKKIFFCCGSCVKAFDANTAYYIKAVPALAKKFTPAEQKKLGADKVKLLEQRFCPIYPERIVNPNSKVEVYKGKKIYFWSSSAVRRWKRDPDKYYAEAAKRGHLPKL
jgi:YHS domain-containing protein